MNDQIISANLNLSCPLCLSKKHNSIFIKNIRSCLDPYFFKMPKVETYPQFLVCNDCESIFRNPMFLLPEKLEHQRYCTHNNSLEDQNYVNYLSESVKPFLGAFKVTDLGLDYGCGPSTGLEHLLTSKNYQISSYDKYFFNNGELLKDSYYDFIFCHEVVEHFRNFKEDLNQVLRLLKPKGKLLIRTELYPNEPADFERWYYKNDSTHIFFLSTKSIQYLETNLNSKVTRLDKNKFILERV